MKKSLYLIVLAISISCKSYADSPAANVLGQGKQPQVSVDNAGIVRVVYGLDAQVFCATSSNGGRTFSKPVAVAHVANMHLGMGRGPQLATSAGCSVITVMDKTGNIHWFRQTKGSAKWQAMGLVNDMEGSAPEGLMAISADNMNNFYAVWLDVRLGKHNQICFSSLSAKSNKWAPNRIIYQSPDGHVCECCKPSIAVTGSTVAVMFRNWLNGSRDLYTMKSADAGMSFAPAQKMGLGTWKLNGCPMDGGEIAINAANQIETVWQRRGEIYFAQEAQPEVLIGKGRVCGLKVARGSTMITYQDNDTLKLAAMPGKAVSMIGTGEYIKSAPLQNNHSVFVWEQNGFINYNVL